MNVINLTPHDIHIYDANGQNVIRTYPASGQVSRVKSRAEVVGGIDGINIVRTRFDEITGLPEPQTDTKHIVSLLVLQAAAGTRDDLIAPDTGPESVVRDENGQIIGCRRFQII